MKTQFSFNASKMAWIVALAACLYTPVSSAELVIIVHKDSPITAASKSELGRVFLGKATTMKDGSKAVPINQPLSTPQRTAFDSNILQRNESQIKSYWSKMLFSGEGTPPTEASDDIAVLQKVMADVTAIGYVDSSAVNDGVRVVSLQ